MKILLGDNDLNTECGRCFFPSFFGEYWDHIEATDNIDTFVSRARNGYVDENTGEALPYDAVVIDLDWQGDGSGREGYEILEELREVPRKILWTSFNGESPQRASELGADYCSKGDLAKMREFLSDIKKALSSATKG